MIQYDIWHTLILYQYYVLLAPIAGIACVSF